MSDFLLAAARTSIVSLYAVSFQIALLIVLVAVASYFLRRSSPAVRYGLWCIVLVRLCIPVELSLPNMMSADSGRDGSRREWQNRRSDGKSALTREQRWRERRQAIARTRQNLNFAAFAWGTIFVGLSGYVGFRALQLRRRIRRLPLVTAPEFHALLHECCTDMGLKRRIEVRYAPDCECAAPAVTSMLTPVVILPETMAKSWGEHDLKPILMHELAHVRRFDVVINWLQIALQLVYFFHPLVWLANWKIRSLREEACDDLSIAHLGGGRCRYSSSLLRAVELAGSARPMCGAVGLHERKSDLVKRLRRLLTEGYQPCGERRSVSALKIAVIGSLCLLVSGLVPASTPFGSPKQLKRVAAASYDCRGKRDGEKRGGRKWNSDRRGEKGKHSCNGRKSDGKESAGGRCEVL